MPNFPSLMFLENIYYFLVSGMNVINIIEEGRLGGPQIRIANVATQLIPEIKTLVLIPEKDSEHFQRKLDNSKVSYLTIPTTKITKSISELCKYILFFPFEITRLYQIFKSKKPDVVHVSGGIWQFKGVIAAKLARRKVVWHLNDTNMPLSLRVFFSVLSPLPDAFIFASHKTKDYYKKFILSKTFGCVIPAPVNTEFFRVNESKVDSNNEASKIIKKNGSFNIGIVGNISPNKGLKKFIETASFLNEKHKNLEFYVVGQVFRSHKKFFTEMLDYAKELNVSNINFFHNVTDVKPFLEVFDAYLCMSKFESSPIAVWEAMSMSIPVISGDVGDVSRHIKSGESGFIVNDTNPQLYAEAVTQIINDPELSSSIGAEARRSVVKSLDIQVVASLHADLYRKVATDFG